MGDKIRAAPAKKNTEDLRRRMEVVDISSGEEEGMEFEVSVTEGALSAAQIALLAAKGRARTAEKAAEAQAFAEKETSSSRRKRAAQAKSKGKGRATSPSAAASGTPPGGSRSAAATPERTVLSDELQRCVKPKLHLAAHVRAYVSLHLLSATPLSTKTQNRAPQGRRGPLPFALKRAVGFRGRSVRNKDHVSQAGPPGGGAYWKADVPNPYFIPPHVDGRARSDVEERAGYVVLPDPCSNSTGSVDSVWTGSETHTTAQLRARPAGINLHAHFWGSYTA